jgi:hypothetical protein
MQECALCNPNAGNNTAKKTTDNADLIMLDYLIIWHRLTFDKARFYLMTNQPFIHSSMPSSTLVLLCFWQFPLAM